MDGSVCLDTLLCLAIASIVSACLCHISAPPLDWPVTLSVCSGWWWWSWSFRYSPCSADWERGERDRRGVVVCILQVSMQWMVVVVVVIQI